MNNPRKNLSALVSVVAVGLTIAGPASADTLIVTCTGADVSDVKITPVPTTNDDVVLKGEGWCRQFPGETVNGNVRITGKAQFFAEGTIYDNVEADTEVAVLLHPAIVYGNVIQDGDGDILVGTVFGNAEMKGLGQLIVGDVTGTVDAAVTGNVINEGAGCIVILARGGRTTSIGGNVESKGIGGGVVSPLPSSLPGLSGCVGVPATPAESGLIFINGNTCGVDVYPEDTGLVAVNGEVKDSC